MLRCAVVAVAADVNRHIENIGARRLHTIIERLCDEISFSAPDLAANTQIVVTKQTVVSKVAELLKQTDLTRFLL
jgi:ATP-dependent HslUV protease ATP-binding subunit HslU